jgi:hypothetical protein
MVKRNETERGKKIRVAQLCFMKSVATCALQYIESLIIFSQALAPLTNFMKHIPHQFSLCTKI